MQLQLPEGTLNPIIYSSFKVIVKDREDVEEFFVLDLPECYFDRAVDFIVANHARGAVFHRAARTLTDECGIQRVRKMYRDVFEEKISLVCIKKGSQEIAGLNALTVKNRQNFTLPPVRFKLLN